MKWSYLFSMIINCFVVRNTSEFLDNHFNEFFKLANQPTKWINRVAKQLTILIRTESRVGAEVGHSETPPITPAASLPALQEDVLIPSIPALPFYRAPEHDAFSV